MSNPTLSESRLGRNLQDALRSDFFQFFHLRVASQSLTRAGGTAEFRPESPQFRDRVAVAVTVDGTGRFQRLALTMDRTVIDNDETQTQARDIVKSFLADATPLADLARVVPWVNDIQFRQGTRGRSTHRGDMDFSGIEDVIRSEIDTGRPVSVWMGGQRRPSLGTVSSAAFDVFLGQDGEYGEKLANCSVSLRNAIDATTATLTLTIAARDPGE